MSDYECPYCGNEDEYTGDGLGEDESTGVKCSVCDKTFDITASYSVCYTCDKPEELLKQQLRWLEEREAGAKKEDDEEFKKYLLRDVNGVKRKIKDLEKRIKHNDELTRE